MLVYERDPNLNSSLTNNDLMKSSLDQSTTQVLQLFPSLNEQIPACRWKFDRDAFANVASPDV